jgi:acyl-CoA dehydrogenase
MEYDDSEKAKEVAERTRAFMDEEVLPTEREYLGTNEQIPRSRIDELREEAKKRNLWGPIDPRGVRRPGARVPRDPPGVRAGGAEPHRRDGRSDERPDEGNIHTLEMVGTDEQ